MTGSVGWALAAPHSWQQVLESNESTMRVCIRLATAMVMLWTATATLAAEEKAPAAPAAKDGAAPAAARWPPHGGVQ